MGTRVQCESYLPGYSSMRNLNEDSSRSWSPFYEDRTMNEHLYNSFTLRREHSGFAKEMLKRTILEHEATFRKQVYELHRLYRTQKDLMDELKMQELYKLPVQSAISQSYLFSSGITSEATGKTWQLPRQTEASIGFNKDSVADTEDIKPSLDLLKENYMQFSQIPRKNEVSLQNCELSDSQLNGRPKQIIDLELPADVCIDVEESCRIENKNIFTPLSRVRDNSSMTCDIEHENDVKLTLGTSESHGKVSWNSDSVRQTGHSIQNCDYLNEIEKGLGSKRQSGFFSDHFLPGRTNPEEVHGHQLPMRSNRNSPPRDFFTDKHRDEGACSNLFDADKGKGRQEWPSFFYKNGRNGNRVNAFTLGLSSEKSPMLSEPLELKVKGEHYVSSHDHEEMQTWLEEKPTLGIRSCQDSPFVDLNNSALTNSQESGPLSVIPFSEHTSCASPVVPIWRRPPRPVTHIPIAVQALPCFPASELLNSRGRKHKQSIQNSTDAHNKLHADGNFKSYPGGGIELSASKNGFHQDLWSDSNSSTRIKHSSDSSIYENSEGCASHKFPKLQNDVSFGRSLPNGTTEDGKLDESSEGLSWLRTKPSCTNFQGEFSFSKSLNQSPENFPSSSQVKEGWKRRNRTSNAASTKKILGFPICAELQQTAICSSGNGIKTELSEAGTAAGKSIRENIIDLNTLEISAEDEVPSITVTRKIMHEIDLEVPMPSYETPDSLAAENLVVMSFGLGQQLAPSSCDSLHWFANVVLTQEAKPDHDLDNEEDAFESLTLQLEEMKPDEYLPQPQEQESRKDENDTNISSLLLTKTRRGQLRKRRQKKDFQKDILPGLVSLSRHEVTEDFQAFDCLMRAMGEAWESTLIRRSTGRKGFIGQGRGRGRRRRQNSTVPVAEKRLSPPPTQQQQQPAVADPKVVISERSIIGWGRTTRRRRRPRVRPGNAIVAVS